MPEVHHVVVDGSNLATEGRTTPSLAQLDEAVRSYLAEDPSAEVVVVVDASFSHRIDPSERPQLEAAELHGEVVAPPAGAIGRGDAFVLRIAERTGAIVLSNDSFQEFHDEHPWLFDEGRLMGGKPVPGVGWIFTPRRPVRGPKSKRSAAKAAAPEEGLSAPRKAAEVAKALQRVAKPAAGRAKAEPKVPAKKAAKKKAEKAGATAKDLGEKPAKKAAKKAQVVAAEATGARAAAKAPAKKAEKKEPRTESQPGAPSAKAAKAAKAKKAVAAAKRTRAGAEEKALGAKKKAKKAPAELAAPVEFRVAIERATEEVLAPTDGVGPVESDGDAPKARRRRRVPPPPAVNEPLAFINFVAAHPLGSTMEGIVASFTSHGAMVDVELDEGGVLHCYAPLAGLGSPAPRAAREVLSRGERRSFSLVSLDPPRRMAELALAPAATKRKRAAR